MDERAARTHAALAHVRWLQACGEPVVDHLAAQSTLERVADGATVTWRGQQMTHLLVPARGALELSISNAQGKRHVINRLGPGQVFGLVPVLDGSGAIHDAVARGDCEIACIPQAALRDAMRLHPDLGEQVLRQLCARSRQFYEALAARALDPLPARLAQVLLGQLRGGESRTVDISQADLADMLGITRQSLNGELKRLERQGLLGLARGRVEIRDPAALKALTLATD